MVNDARTKYGTYHAVANSHMSIECVTTCVFTKVVAMHWTSIKYEHIGKAETSCLRVKNIEGKGKGCMAARAVLLGEPVARERALLLVPHTCLSPAASELG